jgi:hypothetical protein
LVDNKAVNFTLMDLQQAMDHGIDMPIVQVLVSRGDGRENFGNKGTKILP